MLNQAISVITTYNQYITNCTFSSLSGPNDYSNYNSAMDRSFHRFIYLMSCLFYAASISNNYSLIQWA